MAVGTVAGSVNFDPNRHTLLSVLTLFFIILVAANRENVENKAYKTTVDSRILKHWYLKVRSYQRIKFEYISYFHHISTPIISNYWFI